MQQGGRNEMSKSALETIELEVAILIRRSVSSSRKYGNLDRSAYLLLQQIASHGQAGVKALADEFHLDISTVSRQAAALEHKSLAVKVPDPSDGRAYSYQITETGLNELKEYRQARLALYEELLREWTDEEREVFGMLLSRLNRTFLP
jgi:DNA-binding MarR family transcriptional regulator